MISDTPPVDHSAMMLGVVLCGGASSRMGRDKAALRDSKGFSFLAIALARLVPFASTLALAGRSRIPRELIDVDQGTTDRFHDRQLVALGDSQPGSGPLVGVIDALQLASTRSTRSILVVPVDMPLLTHDDLQTLTHQANLQPTIPTLASFDGVRRDPLVAVYPVTVLDALMNYFDQSNRSLNAWLEFNPHHLVHLPGSSAANINTPDQFRDMQ
jgi:molybdopterin-guanine dinucleotide biosynthesis protein A